MKPARARIRRPWLVGLVGAGAIAAAIAAMAGLAMLARVLDQRPVTIVQGAAELGEALEAAPWVALAEEAPIVWVLAPQNCDGCADLFQREIPAIERKGLAVRIILVAPREETDAAAIAWAAHIARTRELADLAPLLDGETLPAPPAADAADIDGHAEWGRAAADRIAAILVLNGADLQLPALFWRRGEEWRALTGAPWRAAEDVSREF